MRQVISKGILTAAAATSILSLNSAYASADSHADGEAANSPGALSGNTVQAPVDVPVNVCGNTVNAVGLLNPASGSACANTSDSGSAAGSEAEGDAVGSPGLLSGNNVKVPVHAPVNLCGNTVDVVGVLNPASGSACTNGTEQPPGAEEVVPPTPLTPVGEVVPNPAAPAENTPVDEEVAAVAHSPQLAETGFGAGSLAAAAAAVGLLAGGGVLYRRGAAGARR
ncbi:chaplin [Streptomyces sp. NPDC057445]|uniref:chaplin n=1 Tax=Streptomyces sp. NPDC057445 TaxID=3346136 RepID=UPI0036BE1440